MKKLTCWLLMAVIVMGLAGCGGAVTKEPPAPVQTPVSDVAEEPIVPMPERAPDVTPTDDVLIVEPEPTDDQVNTEPGPTTGQTEPELGVQSPVEPAHFQSGLFEWTNSAGYRIEQSYGFSDWIRASDTALLEATWSSISDKPIPDVSKYISVGDSWYPKQVYSLLSWPCDEVFYCVGYCKAKNITDGWSITPEYAQQIPIAINCETPFSALGVAWDKSTVAYHVLDMTTNDAAVRLTQGDGYDCKVDWERWSVIDSMYIRESLPANGWAFAALSSDKETVFPFVIAVGVVRGPKYPDGVPKIDEIRVMGGLWDYDTKKSVSFEALPGTTW